MSSLTGVLYGGLGVYLAGWYLGKWTGNFSLLLLLLTIVTFGYWLAEPFWGRGIVTEAVQAVVRHGFNLLPLVRIEASAFASNPASARVLEKCGFTFEGVRRHNVVKDGQILDLLGYSILREECLPQDHRDRSSFAGSSA